MKKMLEILKLIYQKLCIFIQWTKKFYFFHFLIVYLLPSNFITIVAILVTIFDIIEGPNEDCTGVLAIALFLMFFHSICAILLGLVFQIIAMIIKFVLKRTILVTSKFLLDNKIYHKFYYCSMLLILASWLLLILSGLINAIFF